jgi:Replication protein C N-terminal domain
MSGEETISRRAAALFAWLNQVKADGALPASAFKVAFELGQWINGDAFVKDGALIAWPSLETIGAAISMSERTARDMVKRLEARGHLAIKVGHGPGHPSRYTFFQKNRQSAAAVPSEETGNPLPLSQEQNRQSDVAKPAGYDSKTGSRLPTNHLEPSFNHERESARDPTS